MTFSGAGLTAGVPTAATATSLTVPVAVAAGAALGAQGIQVVSGTETVSLAGAFTVTALAPVLTTVNPNTGQQGQVSLSVNITGQSTHFVSGVTFASFGVGIAVASLTVNSATSASAVLNIDFAAATGARNVSLTTGSEVAALSNGFTVTPVSPSLVSVSPNTAQQSAQNVSVLITGQQTHFVQGTTIASFGTGISVASLTVNSQTTATAVLNISANATAGSYTPTMSTGLEAAALTNGFTVTGLPVVTLVSPASVQRSQTNVSVNITGQFTNWVQGITTANFGNGVTTASLTVNSPTTATAVINVSGTAAIGLHTVTMQTGAELALLANGFGVTQAAAAPTVTISTPADTSTVTTLTNVIGTVSSPILKTWTLEYKPTGSGTFLPINTGSTAVSNAALGALDPTQLLNGTLILQLRATDLNGQTSFTSASLFIGSNQKVGNFSISFHDVTVPLPGFNIDLVRTYDTRNQTATDFGVGWSIGLESVRISENRVLGSGWQQTQSGGYFPTYCVGELNSHIISITLPDNTIYKFRPVLNTGAPGNCQQLEPIDQFAGGTVSFAALPGTNASITTVIGYDIFSQTLGPLDLLDFNFDPIDVTMLALRLPDGSTYNIDIHAGLQSARDANGNTITIGPTGITHSAGKSVVFQRDLSSRITQITDPAGDLLKYSYDLNGNLASSTDRAGNQTTYVYNTTHGLLQINDPRGITPLRNIYDDSGRLIQQIDSFGHVTNFSYNVSARQEVITDRLGRATVYEYDTDGNVIRQTDPSGGITQRTFNSLGLILTEIDPLGHTFTNTYDANGNRLTQSDPLGRVTTNTYNALNQLLTRTDPLGRLLTNVYDGNGNMVSQTDAGGNVTTFTVNAQGLRTSVRAADGGLTTYTYDASGNLLRETDPLGVATTYSYDTNGNRLSKSVTRTTASGPQVLLTQYQYDKNGSLTKTINPDGSTVQTVYNSINKPASTTDPRGGQTTYQYDSQGQVIRTTYPDGTSEARAFDAEGNLAVTTDRAGRVTTFQYDALKRLVQTTFPDGAHTSIGYDAAGRVATKTDALGHTTATTYDAAGQVTATTDALGHITIFAYDAAGNQIQMTDANGRITQYTYDALNRKTRTTYPDGTFASTSYDALGRVTGKTDQAGRITTFQNDLTGRLTRVTDALGQVTQFAYDEVANRIAQTDANGHTTRFEYDQMGRLTKRVLPGGQQEVLAYDLAGNQVSRTDSNGKTTAFSYDSMNRLVSKSPDASFGAVPVSFAYSQTGQRVSMNDALGMTTYAYDPRGRMLTKATPFGALTYTYTLAGNLASIRSSNSGGATADYTYDTLNRVATVTDNNLPGASTYTYDAVGNLATVTNPNGVATSYTYDNLNRLTNETVAKGATLASYAYTLGPAGNRARVSELGGRSVNYTYDGVYRLTNETIAGAAANNGAIGYTYDAVGNRLTRTSTSAGVPASASTYDVNDRLTSDSYDANGNTTASGGNSFTYDFEDHLKTATGGISYSYDGDGRRVRKTAGGVTTNYLVDDRNPSGLPQVIEEISSGVVQRVYVYGLNRISQRQGGATSFYVYDGRGTVRLLANAAGTVTDTYNFDAFGIKLDSAGATPNDFLFSGEQLDPNLQFYYMRARYFSQASGRFLTMDPMPGIAMDPPTLHRYTYGSNDPVNRLDPTGLQDFSLCGLMAAVSISQILMFMAPTITTGIIIIAGIELFWKPAFEARYSALDVIASTSSDELMQRAFNQYQAANRMIAIGALSIDLAVKINQLGFAAVSLARSLSNALTASNAIATAGSSIATAADILSLNQKLGSVADSTYALCGAVSGQPQSPGLLSRIQVPATDWGNSLIVLFKFIGSVLGKVTVQDQTAEEH
ncbi:MAG: hypothetical protein NTW28_16760 [Candidatus Solibacter sp.]|nr:hypothetical protein [Candidatus Solibacter sp.]